jgi:putative endonuclease
MNQSKALGNFYESQAEAYLKKQGLKLVEKNYHSRFGEIDLIMTDKKTLCFIEVKARKNNNFGQPEEFVTPSKQRKIILTAEYFLQQSKYKNSNCRFDIVAITHNGTINSALNNADKLQSGINWIKNAFSS